MFFTFRIAPYERPFVGLGVCEKVHNIISEIKIKRIFRVKFEQFTVGRYDLATVFFSQIHLAFAPVKANENSADIHSLPSTEALPLPK